MTGWAMKPGRVPAAFLLLATAVAVGGFLMARKAAPNAVPPPPYRDDQLEAAELMRRCIAAIRDHRLRFGPPIDPEVDPNMTGLIGEELSEITTSVGNLEAKRTATNPAFAALLVRYFREAGLRPGDVVAIGASGSFPSLIIATLSAARVLDLQPITIYSVGASMYGATLPDFTFVEMLGILNQEGLLPYALGAVSLGGDRDAGEGTLLVDGKHVMEEVARRAGVPMIRESTVVGSIRRRLRLYRELASGRPLGCFVNIGGATPNYGGTSTSLDFPNGLVLRTPVMSTAHDRGLIFEFAAAGIPVINLLDVCGLAVRHGLPIDPVPLPRIGEGPVFGTDGHSPVACAAAFVLSWAVLCAGAAVARSQGRRGALRAKPGSIGREERETAEKV